MKIKIRESFGTASVSQIADLERGLNASLPESYKAFLSEHNGGIPTPDKFKTRDGKYETGIRLFFGITSGTYGLQGNLILLKARLPEGSLAIAIDSGGNFILLDINTGSISFFDHELETTSLVSDDFASFIANLFKVDNEDDFDKAVAAQNIGFFKSILETGADVNGIKNKFNQPALIAAALRGRLKLVRFLADNGAVTEGALWAASSNGHFEVVEYLLGKGADPNEKNPIQNNDSALIQASIGGYLEIVKLLISKGADVNATNNHRQTALNKASWSGNKELIQYLKGLNG